VRRIEVAVALAALVLVAASGGVWRRTLKMCSAGQQRWGDSVLKPRSTPEEKAERRRDGEAAMEEYVALSKAVLKRTAKLRALRLAKEAGDSEGKKG
jgi:hypothetical protein